MGLINLFYLKNVKYTKKLNIFKRQTIFFKILKYFTISYFMNFSNTNYITFQIKINLYPLY
jgi:hypothetical protein